MKPKRPLVFFILASLFLLLVYSRFVNLRWGLPYPFHPDERNIANAVQNLTCHTPGVKGAVATSWEFWKTCLDPKFFAYGQLTIYGGYVLVLISRLLTHIAGPIQFDEAVVAIRIISAVSSILTVWVALKIVKMLSDSFLVYLTAFILLIFSPAAIQFAHFGTTESFLMLCYTLLVYICIRYARGEISMGTFGGAAGFVVGAACGAKVSSLVFALLPLTMFLFPRKKRDLKRDLKTHVMSVIERALTLVMFGATIAAVTYLTSIYSFINAKAAISSLDYESAVALGRMDVFYTRMFAYTIPVVFHFSSVFPFALGWFMTALFMIGFILLPWKKEYIVMRLAFLLYFVPSAFTYTKWTRFMAPLFPLMITFGVLTLFHLYEAGIKMIQENKKWKLGFRNASLFTDSLFFSLSILLLMIPGLAYLTIYQTPDVRYRASEWIFKNAKPDAYILQETANAVDIPIMSPDMTKVPETNYQYFSFNFYDLDGDPGLYASPLQTHIDNADFIFVPSRRIFANHTCARKSAEVCQILRKRYPLLNNYYDGLFSGQLGFREVAVFTSYPRIEIFGKTILELPDEVAEETWTVFDHPVIRIYQRISIEPARFE